MKAGFVIGPLGKEVSVEGPSPDAYMKAKRGALVGIRNLPT